MGLLTSIHTIVLGTLSNTKELRNSMFTLAAVREIRHDRDTHSAKNNVCYSQSSSLMITSAVVGERVILLSKSSDADSVTRNLSSPSTRSSSIIGTETHASLTQAENLKPGIETLT